jgi:hypothetical protein
MPEFTFASGEEITKLVAGRTISHVKMSDGSYIDDYLIICFRDGSSLHIKYDYLYEWELKKGEASDVG